MQKSLYNKTNMQIYFEMCLCKVLNVCGVLSFCPGMQKAGRAI